MNKTEFNKKANHPLQSYEWGEARRAMGLEIKRIENKRNVFTMTVHPIPSTKYKVGYLPRSVMPTKEVLDELFDFGQKNNLLFIKIEPDDEKDLSPKPQTTNHELTSSRHPLFPNWTQVLDLTQPEEILLKNLKPKTRYNVNLAKKKGVVVREESNEKGFETFIRLYFDTCRRQRYFGHTKDYHRIVFNHLKDGIARILIAYHEETPLAAYELFFFNNKLYYPYGGTSSEKRNLMASNLLMWKSILKGKSLGATSFDMWGSLPPNYDQNNPWAGFTRFKEGYGTTFVEKAGSYDLVIRKSLYNVYNIVYGFRQIYLSVVSKS